MKEVPGRIVYIDKNFSDMRRVVFYLFLILSVSISAQKVRTAPSARPVKQEVKHEQKVDSLLSRIDSLLVVNNRFMEHLEVNTSLKGRYKLYPTENIFTFLLLDTKTGMIDQVQWSLEEKEEGSVPINSIDLTFGHGFGSGSFELYPTKNKFQFILLEKTTGNTWHVQWGFENNERWIRRIY